MAVPQLVLAGNNNLPMLRDAFSQQDQHGDLLASLVNLTKELVDGQAELFQKLLLVMDTKSEDTSVASASGSVEGIEEEMTLGVKDLFAGAFIALTLWSNELDKYIRTIFLVKALDNLTGLSTKIGNVFKAIGDVWSKKTTTQFLKGDTYKTLGKLTAPIRAIADFFGRILKFLKPVIDTVKGVGSKIGKITKPIMGLFNSLSGLGGIGKTIGPFVKMAEKFAPLAKGILSKVLLPLFAIFDFVSGFIEGFSSKGEDDTRGTMEKIFDGLVGGITKMIKGIFIVPLDLLKDGVSWIAGKMGFEEFSKVLDSFSFTDLFDKMVTKIGEIINGIANWFGTLFTDPIQAIKDLLKLNVDIQMWILGKLASGLQTILNWVGELFSFKGDKKDEGLGDFISKKVKEIFEAVKLWIAETIPGGNKLLETLGLGKVSERTLQEKKLADLEEEARTGTVTFGSDEKYRAGKAKEAAALKEKLGMNNLTGAQLGMNNPTGKQLAQTTQEVATKKEEQNKGQAAPVIVSAGNSGDTNVYGGGTTILGPSLRSIPDQNWMYGGA
jgi:hypothetical protein